MIDARLSNFLLAFRKAPLKFGLPKELNAGLNVLFMVNIMSSDGLAHELSGHQASEHENLLPQW